MEELIILKICKELMIKYRYLNENCLKFSKIANLKKVALNKTVTVLLVHCAISPSHGICVQKGCRRSHVFACVVELFSISTDVFLVYTVSSC